MYLLFPGRHHVLTRFQAEFLRGHADRTVVWAVTSANHRTTKRNPVAFDRREAAIERFSVAEGLRSLVVGVVDTPPTDEFAEVTVKAIEAGTDDLVRLTPENTLVACSTPAVSKLYEQLGYSVIDVEPDGTARPWDVLLMIASADEQWKEFAHPATVDVFERYALDAHIARCVNDPVVGDDGGLTTTRDYKTYADAFETAAERKWLQIKDFVRPGRILDIGCATGATLQLADRDPRFHESDLIGVEVARHLFAECEHKKEQGLFSNPNVYFYQRNMLGSAVFPPRSIDTTLTLALTHEIWSYADGSRPDTVGRGLTRSSGSPTRCSRTPPRTASGSTPTSAGPTSPSVPSSCGLTTATARTRTASRSSRRSPTPRRTSGGCRRGRGSSSSPTTSGGTPAFRSRTTSAPTGWCCGWRTRWTS